MDIYTDINIRVIPRSSKSLITPAEDGTLRVHLNSPPVDGRANEECISLFSRTLKIPKNRISIEHGEKGKRKRLRISGLSREDIMTRITSP